MSKLAVIGAAGTMGSYSARALQPKVDILAYDIKGPEAVEKSLDGINYKRVDNIRDAVKGADFVLFCVPTSIVEHLMREALPYCKSSAIIAGQTSRKSPEAKAFDEYTTRNTDSGLEMVTIHTMCSPDKTDASKEILGIINHKSSNSGYKRAYELFSSLSEHIEEFESVKEHDTAGAYTQINISRTFLSIASSFAKTGCFPWANGEYSSSFDRLKFNLAMRVESQQAHVYRGIQFGSDEGKEIVAKSLEVEHELFKMIVGDERQSYKDKVNEACNWMFNNTKKEPLLTNNDMKIFEKPNSKEMENSHFSIIQWIVSYAALKRRPELDFKATTPMHRAFYCLADRLVKTEELEKALDAPFHNAQLRSEDLIFDREITGWSESILYENIPAYHSRHDEMSSMLDKNMVASQVEQSKKVVELCRKRFSEAFN